MGFVVSLFSAFFLNVTGNQNGNYNYVLLVITMYQ